MNEHEAAANSRPVPLVNRRDVLFAPVVAAAGFAVINTISRAGTLLSQEDTRPDPESGSPWTTFPRDEAKLVAEIVGKSHFDEKRVRELVDAHPSLVNAWWDWGFGDWESPLGAASHTGRRAIAEFLIERGARIDIFAAAMLGYTDVVRAFVAARPGVQRLLGPHGIPLLAHAKAGGAQARATYEYLESLGDSGGEPEATPLTPEEQQRYLGVYSYGKRPSDRFEIKLNNSKAMVFSKEGEADRIIHSVGNREFYPAGVPTTRFRFDLSVRPPTVRIIAGPLLVIAVQDGS